MRCFDLSFQLKQGRLFVVTPFSSFGLSFSVGFCLLSKVKLTVSYKKRTCHTETRAARLIMKLCLLI